VVTAGLAVLTGCSPGSGDAGKPAPAPEASANPKPDTASGAAVLSPGGVTTRVDALAESTEEEYFHACHAARLWMADRQDDPQALVEPYLASVQEPGVTPGPGTFNTPWANLAPGRQAEVIVAARAAAGDECG
jgi:hypothetical protein